MKSGREKLSKTQPRAESNTYWAITKPRIWSSCTWPNTPLGGSAVPGRPQRKQRALGSSEGALGQQEGNPPEAPFHRSEGRRLWWKSTHSSIDQEHYCCCSDAQCPTLGGPTDCSMPGLPVLHYLPECAHTHVHWVGEAIQPSHPVAPSPPALNLSQHQTESFPMSQLFGSYGQIIRVSASNRSMETDKWKDKSDLTEKIPKGSGPGDFRTLTALHTAQSEVNQRAEVTASLLFFPFFLHSAPSLFILGTTSRACE